MVTAKQVLTMDYGSTEQRIAADIWYCRFMLFYNRHLDLYINDIYIDDIRRKILFNDVFYQANRRYWN